MIPGAVRGLARALDRVAGRADTDPCAAATPLRRQAEQRRSRPGRGTRARRLVGALLLGCATVVLAPSSAGALPGVGGCTTPPTPESPRQGITGFFLSAPDPAPATEDPFANGAKTTPFEQYGLAGLSWYAYDLGCGGAARDPSGSVSTWAAGLLFIPAKATVAALTGVSQAALEPTYLSAFDPLLSGLTDTLRKAIYTPLFPLAVMLTGLLLMAQATRQRVSESTTAIGWCVLITVLAAALFAWPVRAGHAADQVIGKGVQVVSTGITGADGEPGDQVANLLYRPFLYRMWLMGEFCDPDSRGATEHGAALLQAQALSWEEANRARTDGEQVTEDKQKRFGEVADRVKKDDPAAYQCVAGHGSSSLEASILADVGVLLMAPFLLIGGLILIAAYLIVRFAIIFAPALLTAGAFFPLRGIVLAAGRVVAAAILNGILFTLSVLLVIRVDAAILDPRTNLPAWLRLVLVGVVTVVMWYLTRPFRKLTTMVTTGRMAFALGDRSWYERGGSGFGRRRGLDAAVADDDGGTVVLAPRDESRGPVGLLRRTAGAVAARGGGSESRPAQIRVPSTRLDSAGGSAAGGAAGALAGAGAGVAGAAGGGAPPGAGRGGPGGGGPGSRGGAAGAAGAARANGARAAGRSGSGTGTGSGTGAGSAPPAGVPVHTPAARPRRTVPSPVRVANRRLDEGLFDAGSPSRVAPEDDGRGYLRPVKVEVADDELYRLFDPKGTPTGNRTGPKR